MVRAGWTGAYGLEGGAGSAVVRDSERAKAGAVRMARMGIALVPIDPVEKEPFYDLLPKDEEGNPRWWPLRENPATPEQIENWFWRSDDDCNIAIITGRPSRLAVLDIDGPTPPDLPELPETVVEKTPRREGGYHHYFRIEGAQRSGMYKWKDGDVDYQCELKADGLYAICAPSSFGATPYMWLPGRSIFEWEPAPLPPSLVDYLEGKKEVGKSERRKGKAARRGAGPAKVPQGRAEDLEWYEGLKCDEDVAIQIMRKCGAEVSAVGVSFLCPLPGHEERHPSAALWYNEAGEIILHDWHMRDGREWYSLANAYALWSTGKQGMDFDHHDKDWPGHNRWWARALHETGCVDKPLPELAMKQELPKGREGAPDNAHIVYEALSYVARLEQWFYGESRDRRGRVIKFPASFTDIWQRVGDTRCMSRSTRQKGLDWLSENGYIEEKDVTDLHGGKVLPSEAARRAKNSRQQGTYVVLTKPG